MERMREIETMGVALASRYEYFKAYYSFADRTLYIGRCHSDSIDDLVDMIEHETLHHVLWLRRFAPGKFGGALLLDNVKGEVR